MGTVKTTTNSDGSTTSSKLRFSYDANGKVVAVNYNGNYYYYLRNAQSDIVKLIDKTGATVVEYRYDSWGKLLSTSGSLASTLGKNNPFRYRGYVYDEETGFYYLQSRYYNPEVGRFISSDVLLSTGQGVLGHNAYAYCGNNPIVREDANGESWLLSFCIGLATQYVGDVVGNIANGKKGVDIFKPTSSVGEYVAAGVTALIPGSGLVSSLARSAVTEGILVIEDVITGKDINIRESVKRVAVNTMVDFGLSKGKDKLANGLRAKTPKNYSSYAHELRLSNPDISMEQIRKSMSARIKRCNVLIQVSDSALDIAATLLPIY